jgi:hypothetical protein
VDLLAEVYTTEQRGAAGFGWSKKMVRRQLTAVPKAMAGRRTFSSGFPVPGRAWWSQKAGQEPSFGLKRELLCATAMSQSACVADWFEDRAPGA